MAAKRKKNPLLGKPKKVLSAPQIKAGTGKLKGRYCVRVPSTTMKTGMKMLGCFKSKAAAEARIKSATKA